jgi:NADH-quinone oxidoreductase subunit N
MMLAMFSLAGIPPLAGFLGKIYLFAAAAEVRLYWLVFVGVVNATISLYYYLTVLRWMYLVKPEAGREMPHVPVPWPGRIALVISVGAMVLFGVIPQVIAWTEAAAARGF